ncbi:hypothetical protein SAMN04487781_3217 [Cellulosimicrobium cellulans]|nr:hypothetical protein SAMN04487781_3217 [Cellulosimicrobium cellulans]
MRDLRHHVGKRIIVLLDEKRSIEGTLARAAADSLELEHAAHIDAEMGTTPIDGLAVIPAATVYWVQVP